MNGTFTATDGAQVTIHTYTAPEEGWMTTSNLIELPTQLILVDTPLLPDSTNEVLTYAKDLGKPTSRVYISHGHPDHFAGAGRAGAPLYALPSVAAAINNGGGAIIRGALALTGHDRIVA